MDVLSLLGLRSAPPSSPMDSASSLVLQLGTPTSSRDLMRFLVLHLVTPTLSMDVWRLLALRSVSPPVRGVLGRTLQPAESAGKRLEPQPAGAAEQRQCTGPPAGDRVRPFLGLVIAIFILVGGRCALSVAGVAMTLASIAEELAAAAQAFNEAQHEVRLMKWFILSLSIRLPRLMAILILMKQMQCGFLVSLLVKPTSSMDMLMFSVLRPVMPSAPMDLMKLARDVTVSKGRSVITGWVSAIATCLQTAGKGKIRKLYPSKRRKPKKLYPS